MSVLVATRRALLTLPKAVSATGWWTVAGKTCIAAYRPKGAASLAASYSNLANPGTRDGSPVSGEPTFDAAKGWVGKSGCSGVVVGGYTTAGSQAYTAVARVDGTVDWGDFLLKTSGTNAFDIALAPSLHQYLIGSSGSGWLSGSAAGVYAVRSDDGAQVDAGFLNGVSEVTSFSAALPAGGYTLICGPVSNVSLYIACVAWYLGGLSDAEIATLSANMAAL